MVSVVIRIGRRRSRAASKIERRVDAQDLPGKARRSKGIDAQGHRVTEGEMGQDQLGHRDLGDQGAGVRQGKQVGVAGHEIAWLDVPFGDDPSEGSSHTRQLQAGGQESLVGLGDGECGSGLGELVFRDRLARAQAQQALEVEGLLLAGGDRLVGLGPQQLVVELEEDLVGLGAVALEQIQAGDAPFLLAEEAHQAAKAQRAGALVLTRDRGALSDHRGDQVCALAALGRPGRRGILGTAAGGQQRKQGRGGEDDACAQARPVRSVIATTGTAAGSLA